MNNISVKASYHHGDLRSTLIDAACEILNEHGIKEVSLRKLAAKVGVSRAAPYHHFKDKNELLCAIADQGFRQLNVMHKNQIEKLNLTSQEKFRDFIHSYVDFAENNPELYDLMFGRTIWKNETSTQELKDSAYPCFQFQVGMIKAWQKEGILYKSDNPLRTSQVLWGTIHGIAKLFIDGIYTDAEQIEEILGAVGDIFIKSEDK